MKMAGGRRERVKWKMKKAKMSDLLIEMIKHQDTRGEEFERITINVSMFFFSSAGEEINELLMLLKNYEDSSRLCK